MATCTHLALETKVSREGQVEPIAWETLKWSVKTAKDVSRLAFSCIVSSIGLQHEQTIRLVTCRFASDRPKDRVNWCVIRLLFTWNVDWRPSSGDVFSCRSVACDFFRSLDEAFFRSKVSSVNFRKEYRSNKKCVITVKLQ